MGVGGGRHSSGPKKGVGVDRSRIRVPSELQHQEQVQYTDRGEPISEPYSKSNFAVELYVSTDEELDANFVTNLDFDINKT